MVEKMTLEELETELLKIPKDGNPANREFRRILLTEVYKRMNEKVNGK